MRPCKDLSRLFRSAEGRLDRLRSCAATGLASDRPQRDKLIAYVAIETQNLWSNFCRSYLISCVLRPKRHGKPRVTLGNAAISNPVDAILLANRIHRGAAAPAPTSRREEPPWHDSAIFLKTCMGMGCSHVAEVQAALSVSTAALQHLPVFRNFYAHRNDETARKAVSIGRQYLIVGYMHPTDVLSQPTQKRPQALILDWIDDIESIISFLCE
jgi:hypothetical protein